VFPGNVLVIQNSRLNDGLDMRVWTLGLCPCAVSWETMQPPSKGRRGMVRVAVSWDISTVDLEGTGGWRYDVYLRIEDGTGL
jgi:hypothetical protein